MNLPDINSDDEAVAADAVKALQEAFVRAKQAGREMVLVENGELVRIGPSGRKVLKSISGRKKSSVRVKRIAP